MPENVRFQLQKNKILTQKEMVAIFEGSEQVYGANKIHAKLKLLSSRFNIPSRVSISRYVDKMCIDNIITTSVNIK